MTLARYWTLFENCGDVMTVKEVAATIKCSESFILDMIHDDILPCFTIGKHYRVLQSDVIKLLAELFNGDLDLADICGDFDEIFPEELFGSHVEPHRCCDCMMD